MRTEERQAFEVVFRSSYASVLRTVFVILHDRERAEEVTQDAFLRLYEKWGGVRPLDVPGRDVGDVVGLVNEENLPA
jgi:RNA polymerase sigma-70 factor (ECF subfamily)